MSDRPFTLIDVENGMFDLSLHTILTPPCFTFFWGIIQSANRLKPRFKNPFTLTISQAFAAGGGHSRQSVWTKQQQLNKVRIEGQWLIKITAGSKSRYVPATYKINYKLLMPQNVMIPEFNVNESKIIDTPIDTGVDTPVDTGVDTPVDTVATFLRSDQRRGEKNKTTEAVVVSPSSPEPEPVLTTKSDATIVEGAILAKYRSQIGDVPPAPMKVRDALEAHSVDQLTEAIDRMPLVLKPKKPTTKVDGNYVLSMACLTAKNPHWFKPAEVASNGRERNELQELYKYRASLESERKQHGDNADLLGYIANNEADIARLEGLRNGTT